MKNSEQLRRDYLHEDNNLIAQGLYTKMIRAEKEEDFRETLLPALMQEFTVEEYQVNGFIIKNAAGRRVRFYPKAGKLLDQKNNRWSRPKKHNILTDIKNLLK